MPEPLRVYVPDQEDAGAIQMLRLIAAKLNLFWREENQGGRMFRVAQGEASLPEGALDVELCYGDLPLSGGEPGIYLHTWDVSRLELDRSGQAHILKVVMDKDLVRILDPPRFLGWVVRKHAERCADSPRPRPRSAGQTISPIGGIC